MFENEQSVANVKRVMKLWVVIFIVMDFITLIIGVSVNGGLVSTLMVYFGVVGLIFCAVMWAVFKTRFAVESTKNHKAAWAFMCACLAPLIVGHALEVYLLNKGANEMLRMDQEMDAKISKLRYEAEHLNER